MLFSPERDPVKIQSGLLAIPDSTRSIPDSGFADPRDRQILPAEDTSNNNLCPDTQIISERP